MAGPFELQLRKFAERAGKNADAVVRKVVLDVGARLVLRSPVDTGRFRSNWFYSIDAPNRTTTTATGIREVNNITAAPVDAMGRVHYICNSLPYARRIEHGWSKQAPIGLVGLTTMEFNTIVNDAAREAADSLGVLGVR